MLAEKEKVEKEQNLQLKNQVSQLQNIEQEQKTQIRDRDLTIQSLQVKENVFYFLFLFLHVIFSCDKIWSFGNMKMHPLSIALLAVFMIFLYLQNKFKLQGLF